MYSNGQKRTIWCSTIFVKRTLYKSREKYFMYTTSNYAFLARMPIDEKYVHLKKIQQS